MMEVDRANETPDAPMGEVAAFCDELADACRAISLTYFRKGVSIDIKDDRSPVTIADREVEQLMRRRIAERFPQHGIVGEEEEARKGARYTWYLDPIDGTKSFISGMPLFGALIALRDDVADRIVFGMIDIPALGERWSGDGATCRFNGRPARVSGCGSLREAQVYTSSPDIFSAGEWAVFDRVSRRAAFRRFGGDCYLYGLLASGHCDLVIESSLKPFDFMALVPVVEGAGGCIRDWDGEPLSPQSDGRVVAAASERLLLEALEAMQPQESNA